MKSILTIVASSHAPLADECLSDITARFNCPTPPAWLAPGIAACLTLHARPGRADIEWLWRLCAPHRYDVFVTPAQNRRKKLLIADMDATIVTGETLDELAAHAGLHDRVAAITARAMAGELDFKAALRERVSLLKDLDVKALEQTLRATQLSPGARVFTRTMSAAGALCVLVSGGFTYFTGPVAEQAGFHLHHGNVLNMAEDGRGGRLDGTVADPILDRDAKLNYLNHYCAKLEIAADDVLAIGDGANDLPMLLAAGLGIGYRPKPLVVDKIDNCIFHGDLTAALYAQGFERSDFTGHQTDLKMARS